MGNLKKNVSQIGLNNTKKEGAGPKWSSDENKNSLLPRNPGNQQKECL